MLTSRRPALCIVNPFEHGGGAEFQISLLIDALVDAGEYEIHYLTHFTDTRETIRNYQVSQIGNGGPLPHLGYIMDARSLYRQLSAIGPSVIYQRVACAYTGVCAFYARRRAVPLVWHVAHDSDVTPQNIDLQRNFIRPRLEKWAVAYGARNADRIVVQSRRQAELLQTNYARTADALIANFHPPANETIDKSGPLTVVWIANLKTWKRPEIFLRLAQALSGSKGVRFVMVGAPPPASANRRWREPLMRSIKDAANLQYLGHRSHAQVNELLARAHILVNTSTQEGFPNTFIQSWLRDVAVVSLQVDPDRVLELQQAGIIAHTEAGLLAAVRSLLENDELRAAYTKRGREHAIACHSLRNARELVRLIEAQCANTSGLIGDERL
jgi:glycosyltransferase involved in cell wall biosynthesis